jgi:hypothetical protein
MKRKKKLCALVNYACDALQLWLSSAKAFFKRLASAGQKLNLSRTSKPFKEGLNTKTVLTQQIHLSAFLAQSSSLFNCCADMPSVIVNQSSCILPRLRKAPRTPKTSNQHDYRGPWWKTLKRRKYISNQHIRRFSPPPIHSDKYTSSINNSHLIIQYTPMGMEGTLNPKLWLLPGKYVSLERENTILSIEFSLSS